MVTENQEQRVADQWGFDPHHLLAQADRHTVNGKPDGSGIISGGQEDHWEDMVESPSKLINGIPNTRTKEEIQAGGGMVGNGPLCREEPYTLFNMAPLPPKYYDYPPGKLEKFTAPFFDAAFVIFCTYMVVAFLFCWIADYRKKKW